MLEDWMAAKQSANVKVRTGQNTLELEASAGITSLNARLIRGAL